MSKSTTTYWNPLAPEQRARWTPIKGLEGMAEEITLSIDSVTGEYTRLTRFLPGADTSAFGGKAHAYPEEVFIADGCTTRPLIAGLKRESTQVALPENVMVRLRPMSGVWCWRCHSPTGWWAERVANKGETLGEEQHGTELVQSPTYAQLRHHNITGEVSRERKRNCLAGTSYAGWINAVS